MSMRVKVIGGTPQHDTSLCATCTNRKMRRGVRFADVWFGCEEFAGPIAQPVIECSSYHDARLTLPMEVTRQAFRWVPSLGTFISPVEWEMKRANNKLKSGDY